MFTSLFATHTQALIAAEASRIGGNNELARGRYFVLVVTCLIGMVYGLVFGSVMALTGVVWYALADYVTAFTILLNFILLYVHKSIRTTSIVQACIAGPFFFYMFVFGGNNGSGALWSMLLPLVLIFLLGAKDGAIAAGWYLIALLIFLFGPPIIPHSFDYSPGFQFRFLGVYVIVFLVSLTYEVLRQRTEIRLNTEIDTHTALSQELTSAKEHLEKLNNIVPNAIVTVDMECRITTFNKNAEDLTGFSAAEIIGKKCDSLIAGPLCETCRLFEGGDTDTNIKNVECQLKRKDGTEIPVLKNANVLKDESGTVIAGIESFQDISEQKKIQEKHRAARQEAEMANVAKSAFLANMSHEIRTPMNGILGMNTLLSETELNEEQQEYSENIQSSSEALLKIINDILDYSKIEAGKLDLDSIPFDLRTTIENAMELIAYKAADKELDVSTLVHARTCNWLVGDPGRLRQILINLAGNAVKFTEKGEVALSVESLHEDEDSTEIKFEVSDTGIGISSEKIDRLFQSFSQVDQTVTRRFGGTGLGLAISRRLVQKMGGNILVKSKEGEGSSFSFTLRFARQKNPVVPVSFEQMEKIKRLKILVADSHTSSRNALAHYLQSWGCTCVTAATAKETLEALRDATRKHHPFDVLITENRLPVLPGKQMALFVSSARDIAHLKIIVLSLVGKRGDAAIMKKAGVNGYLTKPLKHQQILDAIIAVTVGSAKGEPAPQEELVTRHTLTEMRNREKSTVLIAEDNKVNQKVVSRILEKSGYICDVVHNGLEAVQAWEKNSYTLILMDCQMPILSGFDATRSIREEEHKKKGQARIPIIALTANAMKGDQEKCLASGMDDYLSKPVNKNALLEKIEKWSQR